jgi:hypothetical protein
LTLHRFRATIQPSPPTVFNPNHPAASGSRLETKVSRMAWKPFLSHCRLWLLCAVVVLSGCREQESIRHYLAPKDTMPEPPAKRMLAVMVPRAKEAWFFKILGVEKEVTKHEADFDALIRSVRFEDKGETPITFETPPQWRRKSGPRPRYATLMLGPKGEGLEITITKLGPESSDVRQNVDRWRNQLGLPPLDDETFRKLHNNIKVDGIPATRVDWVGVFQEEAMPKQMPPQRARRDALPFRYTTPEGWEARPPMEKQGVSLPLVFRLRGNGQEAEMTAMALPEDGGGVALNVNRWRGQVGLAPIDGTQIEREARALKVAEKQAVYVDLSGTGATAKRILGVILPLGRETWFFTLKGSAELVGKEQSHFEAFLTSLRLNGEAGAAHE